MTAEAKGVKKIAVNFNKTVDTTTTKLVVKKGAATPTVTSTTFAADAKSAEIVMGTKLTEGVYTVEATVGEEKLTANVTVQDEKLTKFELVGNNLVATPASKSAATISFKALNQYGEMMAADSISNPTCSFGKATLNNAPTADKTGKITVSGIPDVLAVEGQTGTLVFVDSQTGVTANETVTYRSKAVAAKATVYGIYDTKKDKLVEGNLKVGDTIANYKILMNIQNQYESDMTPDDIKASDCEVSFNPASVLTDVDLAGSKITNKSADSASFTSLDELTYDGKSCMLIPLKVKSGTKVLDAGSLNLTIVSANKGVLATPSFKIDDAVMIQSFSVSPKTTVYGGQDNELVVDATDVNGNAVTSYTDLKAAVETQGLPAGVTLKKNSDGTGTFWYNPGSIAGTKNDKWKKSELKTLVFKVNPPASGNYLVKTANVTAYANRLGWKVSGVTSDTTTATATNKDLVFKLKTLTYEDQYSTAVKYSDDQLDASKISAYLDDSKNIFGGKTGAVTFTKDKDGNLQLELKGGANKGNATLYLRYKNDSDLADASADKYDLKVTLSVVDVDSLVASDLTMKINDGNAIYGVAKANLGIKEENATAGIVTKGAFNVSVVVTATINGKTVVIPAKNCNIVDGGSLGDYGAVSSTNPAKTEEKTVTVVVESSEGPQTITGKVTVSSVDPAAKTIKAASKKDISVTSGTAITATQLGKTVDVKDQYGAAMSKANDIRYKVTFTGKNASDYQKAPYIIYNETQKVVINLPAGEYTATVEYKLSEEVKFSQDIKITVTK